MHIKPRRRLVRALAVTVPLALFGALTPALASESSPSSTPEPLPAPEVSDGERATTDNAGRGPGTYQVTLLTGDVVQVQIKDDGPALVEVTVAERADGSKPAVDVIQTEGRISVVPQDVRPSLAAGWMDRNLFDVGVLIDAGYVDGARDGIPLVVQFDQSPGKAGLLTDARKVAGSTGPATALTSIDGVAITVDAARAADFWAPLAPVTAAGKQRSTDRAPGALRKVWLDQPVEADLAQSVPLIGAPEVWAAGFDGSGIRVAVVDSGVDANHPDLAGQIVAEHSFVPNDPSAQDGLGHGTHVAATIAGTGTASPGGKGVAPGAAVINGRVLNDAGSGQESAIIEGMEWAAAEQDADIVNLSLGCATCLRDGTGLMDQAVDRLSADTGALFVVSAGNSGPNEQTVGTPGSAASALTVAALDKQDQLAEFSSRGPRAGDVGFKPEIAAPGVNIVAARAAGTSLGTPLNDYYTAMSGTSMAAPHVAGVAALLLQRYPTFDREQLKSVLTTTAVDAGFKAYQQGGGQVDAARATRQTLVSRTATVDFGRVGADTTQAIVLANEGTEPVSAAITGMLAAGDSPAPDGTLTVTPDTVTIAPGGTATVQATYRAPPNGQGVYTGKVQATAGDQVLAVPVAAAEYSEVQVAVPTRSDADAGTEQCSTVVLYGLTDASAGTVSETELCGSDQQADLKVPAGTYWAAVAGYWVREGSSRHAVLLDQEVEISDGTELTFDLDDAEVPEIVTPRPAEVLTQGSTLERVGSDGDGVSWTMSQAPTSFSDKQPDGASALWSTGTVRTGTFTFLTSLTLGAPAPAGTPVGERAYYYGWFPEFDALPDRYVVAENQLATVSNRIYTSPDDPPTGGLSWYPADTRFPHITIPGIPTGQALPWYLGPSTSVNTVLGMFQPTGIAGIHGVDRGLYSFDGGTDYQVRWAERPRVPGPAHSQLGDLPPQANPYAAMLGWLMSPCNGCREGNMFGAHVGYVSPDARNNVGAAGVRFFTEPLGKATEGISLHGQDGTEIEPFTHYLCDGNLHPCTLDVNSLGDGK